MQQLFIDSNKQTLQLLRDGRVVKGYLVSTALNGLGEQEGSERTPRGWHRVSGLIGHGCEVNTIFKGRKATGGIYHSSFSEADWILTRIIRLSGCEPSFNSGAGCDTYDRFIYIHGTPDKNPMGKPLSHGCIRMRNQDVMDLFASIKLGDGVYIR